MASAVGNYRVFWTVVDATRLVVLHRHRGRGRSRTDIRGAGNAGHGCLAGHHNVRQTVEGS